MPPGSLCSSFWLFTSIPLSVIPSTSSFSSVTKLTWNGVVPAEKYQGSLNCGWSYPVFHLTADFLRYRHSSSSVQESTAETLNPSNHSVLVNGLDDIACSLWNLKYWEITNFHVLVQAIPSAHQDIVWRAASFCCRLCCYSVKSHINTESKFQS